MFIEVTRFNLTNATQHIQSLLKSCDFVAMDTEFTGLGRSEDTRSKYHSQLFIGLEIWKFAILP
jgi:hypothetical protein